MLMGNTKGGKEDLRQAINLYPPFNDYLDTDKDRVSLLDT